MSATQDEDERGRRSWEAGREMELTSENQAKHDEYMTCKILKDVNKMLSDRLNKELSDLESRHAKELSVLQTQLAHYKKTVEKSLKVAQSEVQFYKTKVDELKFEAENERRMQNLHFQKEKDLLNEQITLLKAQLKEMTSKYITSLNSQGRTLSVSTLSKLGETLYKSVEDSIEHQMTRRKLEEKTETEELLVEEVRTLKADLTKARRHQFSVCRTKQSSLMSDTEAKKSQKELEAVMDKTWLLRSIITDLEQHLQAKIEKEESLQMQINQLEAVITASVQELDAIKSGSENRHLKEQINHLQEELSKHKLSSEHFNVISSILKKMKAEKEIFLKTVSEQLLQIETMQIKTMRGRFYPNKQSAPFAQEKTTSRLELQLHEATTKYHSLIEQITIIYKEIELKELKAQLEMDSECEEFPEAAEQELKKSSNRELELVRTVDFLKEMELNRRLLIDRALTAFQEVEQLSEAVEKSKGIEE